MDSYIYILYKWRDLLVAIGVAERRASTESWTALHLEREGAKHVLEMLIDGLFAEAKARAKG